MPKINKKTPDRKPDKRLTDRLKKARGTAQPKLAQQPLSVHEAVDEIEKIRHQAAKNTEALVLSMIQLTNRLLSQGIRNMTPEELANEVPF